MVMLLRKLRNGPVIKSLYILICFGIGGMIALPFFFQYRNPYELNLTLTQQLAKSLEKQETIDISSIKANVANVTNIRRQIFDLAIYLKKARLHARGSKTQRALKYASENMDAILRGFGTSFEAVTRRKLYKSSSMCPEYYVDKVYGHLIKNCSYSKRLEEIVTIIRLNYDLPADKEFTRDGYGSKIPVIIGDYSGNIKEKSNIVVKKMTSTITEGEALNMLMENVKTTYTLVLRNVTELDWNARIERLVREIEILNVNAVGGSIRNSDNIWSLGCHQRVYRNYTVVYEEGYDESLHDCAFCDHMDGPFLIKTKTLNEIKFDSKLSPMGLYEDFFMRLNTESAVCADSLFDMDFPRRSKVTKEWESFGRKRNLYRLKFSFGLTLNFGCDYEYPCQRKKGFVRSPCCIQELADLSYGFMDMCEKEGGSCQLNAGTILGAVKMYDVIPWEIDADLNFRCQDFNKLQNGGLKLMSKGITVRVERRSVCSPSAHPAQLGARSKHWHADIWSRDWIEPYEVRAEHRNLTKIPFNGRLLNGMRNPGLFARNMYPEIFFHQQHVKEGGIKKVHKFSKCPMKDNHDCIDNYYEDGNIQFHDPVA
ncbi:uncharacterized protein LOC132544773 [Ylistrum balloti]|uniref:uncharacterized protein LOC132544773 n=1 Tax=Ylistrum balloti TaxID=509963 RepID=UPI002905B423|nr:uncharacterized protein LOC132544773 [Ylistrum balloti]